MRQMLDFRERSRLRRFIYSKPSIFILFFFVILTAHGAWGMFEKSREAKIKEEKALLELGQLSSRHSELEQDINKLSTERGQEEEIRNRFMVAKDGEKVIIISQPVQEEVHSVTVTDIEEKGFLDSLKSVTGVGEE